MTQRYPRLFADDLNRVRASVFMGRPAWKTAQGPRYVCRECRECGETLGVCSCFRPVRLTP